MNISEAVCVAAARRSGQAVSEDTPLDQLELDSLDLLDLLVEISIETDIPMPSERIAEFETVGDIARAFETP